MTDLQDRTRVSPEALRVRVDPALLGFETTAEIEPLAGIAAQDRAVEAIGFSAAVQGAGFNVYAAGPQGTGRRSALRRILAERSASMKAFDDWVYVYNFADEHRPQAMRLPAGTAVTLRDGMAALVEELVVDIPAAFEAEEYKTRRDALEAEREQGQEEALSELRERARGEGIEILRSPVGFMFAPTRNGEVVKPDAFQTWDEAEKRAVQEKIAALQREMGELLKRTIPGMERQLRAALRTLDRETASAAIDLAIAERARSFAGLAQVTRYLEAVAEDLRDNFMIFRALAQAVEQAPMPIRPEAHPALRRYSVNVLDARKAGEEGHEDGRAPIVEEPDPTLPNLIGRIEHQTREGALVTDFTMIRPGALHRANGGFLILDARDLLTQPFAWESLKRALKTGEIRFSGVAERLALVQTVSLEPDPIPLSVKVALIGDRWLYHMLAALDPDFPRLFKVLADFDDEVDNSPDSLALVGRVLATVARQDGLKPFAAPAVARVLEEASRMADDAAKVTLRIDALADLMTEADHIAGDAGTVQAEHVEAAVRAAEARGRRLRDRSAEMITREIVTIATEGTALGEINGLSVLSIGNIRFGRPARISARVRVGPGRIIDIEREAKLGGPLHSKGVMILSGFLAARFGRDRPVSLSASLVFEQSYGGVDGDSASSTELYALLSALSGVPIRQGLAVTGSVDQTGRVQAIGG
jgi:predicted ATP-dependent protease